MRTRDHVLSLTGVVAVLSMLFTPNSAAGQGIQTQAVTQAAETDCAYYCRPSNDGESGSFQCDNLEVTQAPCTGRWWFGMACYTGCVEEETLAQGEKLEIAPDGSLVPDQTNKAVLASNPTWGHALDMDSGRMVVRSSCTGAISARVYDAPSLARIKAESSIIVL